MRSSAIVAYGHSIGIMVIFAALVTETLTLRQEMTLPQAWRISIADGVYGLAATLVLVTGILQVLVFGKGTDDYLHQPVFWAKVAMFGAVSLLSIVPTVLFIRWIAPLRAQRPPTLSQPQVSRLQLLIRQELVGVAVIPLLASMVARHIGGVWIGVGGG
jgi:putative membrane protein